MSTNIDALLQADPIEWIRALPEYQSKSLVMLLEQGSNFDDVAQTWISASAANTYRFASASNVNDKSKFLESLKQEVRLFLCGDKKYDKERKGLFGEKGLIRTYVVSSMAVAIAPHLSVAAAAISPLIALVLASMGKVTLNAWCATQGDSQPISPPTDAD